MRRSAIITGESDGQLWGLGSALRMERQLGTLGVDVIAAPDALAADCERLLAINAAFLFEVRTFRLLLEHERAVLVSTDTQDVAAVVGPPDQAASLVALCAAENDVPEGFTVLTIEDLSPYDDHLRRTEPPLLRDTRGADPTALESELYGNAYKGITDFVTKWWWPRPARHLVRWCAQLQVSPNAVTITGLVLVVLATLCFAAGWFVSGLALGWIMTLLDTVDGKLARVTVQSSRLGHALDHGMDIIHPPFWYVYWGIGLGASPGLDAVAGISISTLNAAVVAGYVGGRAIEGLFHALGSCSMFAWRPLDAYFRLVTARRNPCLVILTAGVAVGRPELGFLGVVTWTLLSTALMLLRLVYAAVVRLRSGPLQSWLSNPDRAARDHAAAFARFSATRAAYD